MHLVAIRAPGLAHRGADEGGRGIRDVRIGEHRVNVLYVVGEGVEDGRPALYGFVGVFGLGVLGPPEGVQEDVDGRINDGGRVAQLGQQQLALALSGRGLRLLFLCVRGTRIL